MSDLKAEFLKDCVQHLNEHTKRVKICLDLITEEQAWQKPNEVSNSVANLILHLCGNMTQYVLSSLGGEPDNRQRDLEFTIKGGWDKDELFKKLSTVVESVTKTILAQDERSLLTTRAVQGFNKSGLSIILHITEHYSYHTGQIALITKLLRNKDLGFYKSVDLNQKNKL